MLQNISKEMGFSGIQSFIFIVSFIISAASILAYMARKEGKKEISKVGWVSMGVMATNMLTPLIPIVAIVIIIAIPFWKKYLKNKNKGGDREN